MPLPSERSEATIVIACPEGSRFLPEAVESVLAQTLPAREVIVVHDGSTDAASLHDLERRESGGVTFLRTSERSSFAARNLAIERARGRYVVCMDADDLLMPEFLEATVPVLDASPAVAFVGTHVAFLGQDGGLWRASDFSPTTLLWDNCVGTTCLFRRSCWHEVGGYDDLAAWHDWSFWISIVERGWKWEIVREPLRKRRGPRDCVASYRKANRAALLRLVVAHHHDTYARNWADVIVEMDAEIQRLRDRGRGPGRKTTSRSRATLGDPPGARNGEAEGYDALKRRLRRLVEQVVPNGARVMVVSHGDDALLSFDAREGWHLPCGQGREYAGYHPRDSREAIEHLERLRARECDFLILPSSSIWWLDHYDGFRRHVEQSYPLVARKEDTGVIFDTRVEVEPRTFSVVVFATARARWLREAVDSVLAQDYPKTRYELVVVDDGSADRTRGLVSEYLRRADVRVAYHDEARQGPFAWRAPGSSPSEHEYVAFLDENAVAAPHWLAAFNAVVHQYDAAAIAGRVEAIVEPRVARIDPGLQLKGHNIAYARRVVGELSGAHGGLGRDLATLLSPEVAYIELERRDIALYYADDAVVEKLVCGQPVTTSHDLP
jgi:glycosyltransferase involved in cell wall biosynthesis